LHEISRGHASMNNMRKIKMNDNTLVYDMNDPITLTLPTKHEGFEIVIRPKQKLIIKQAAVGQETNTCDHLFETDSKGFEITEKSICIKCKYRPEFKNELD
jgi:hypothetical protein